MSSLPRSTGSERGDRQRASESDSNRCRNAMALESMKIVPLRVPHTVARRRDISLTLAM